jgi:hypothetical protein
MIQSSKSESCRDDLSKLIEKAIEMYNRYRGAEAKAVLVSVSDCDVKVAFEGYFCFTCGVNDWIEDFKYVLEDIGVETDLYRVLEPEDFSELRRVGVFKIKKVKSNI